MHEHDWLACSDPQAMLEWLRCQGWGNERRFRLFACACVRRSWDWLTDERSRRAVEIAERYADGLAGDQELEQAKYAARQVLDQFKRETPQDDDAAGSGDAAYAAWICCRSAIRVETVARLAAWSMTKAAQWAVSAVVDAPESGWHTEYDAEDREQREQAMLLRDIFGNPFQPVAESSSTWRTQEILSLARSIYEGAAFDWMPQLAHMLAEAGCRDQELVEHCREPDKHARGCHVLDRILNEK